MCLWHSLFAQPFYNCKNWVSFLRKLYDTLRLKQIWITGSNANLIKKEYATLLTGRNLSIKIYPLSFREFLNFRRISYNKKFFSNDKKRELKKEFLEYQKYGSFPEIALREIKKRVRFCNCRKK